MDLKTQLKVAVKLENKDTVPIQCLERESQIIKVVQDGKGFPSVLYFGRHLNFSCMVLPLYGSNLEKLFKDCGGKFTLKTVLMIGD